MCSKRVIQQENITTEERSKTACFTGHRHITENELPVLMRKLEETVARLVGQGITRFISGGAVGFDTLAAFAVLTARKQNSGIKLILALPCTNQDEGWSKVDRQTYRHLLDSADEVVYVSDQPYSDECIKQRNIYLVENSGVCVAYMKRGSSGTSQTVCLAREQGLTVINLAE